ncbi:MAG: YeaH/YhbH family protein, partial [Gammaproteobacteria bacterium]
MTQIIDRRLNGKNKSAVNRQRFIRRFKSQIRKAAAEAVSDRSITDASEGERVNIPARDISEPQFRHGEGGKREIVYPGNSEFLAGDRLPRPRGGAGGRGRRASNDGSGEDDFAFQLSRDEFLECFFEDLELPNMAKTQLKQLIEYRSVRAGYTRDGVPANINIIRSLRGAMARRIAMGGPYRGALREVEREIAECENEDREVEDREVEDREIEVRDNDGAQTDEARKTARLSDLYAERERLRRRLGAIPFIDTFDLRFNNRIQQPKPTTQAVMFCLMDVSGSMDEQRKELAKRFFILLYLFLTRSYERIDVVFIRHHVFAKEVEEEEFFYARETGGTVVSSALKLMSEICT